MHLKQLTYFVEVADKQSLSYASKNLFISQQALSTSIKNLEKEFQTELFVRTPKGMMLSEDGRYFYEIAVQILKLSNELYNHFIANKLPEVDILTVAINKKNKDYFFTKIISLFYKKYPQYNIEYMIMNRAKIIEAVATGQTCLGVISLLKINNQFITSIPEELYFIPFNTSKYSLLTCSSSPLCNLNTISIETIVKYPIVLMAESDLANDLFYEMVMHYNQFADIIWADSIELQEQLVADGLGNMFILRNATVPKQMRVIPINNFVQIESGFLCSNKATKPELQEFFIEKAIKEISQKDSHLTV